jgi:hypothetical protein
VDENNSLDRLVTGADAVYAKRDCGKRVKEDIVGGAETDIISILRVAKIVPEKFATLGLFGKLNAAKENSAGRESHKRKSSITYFYIRYLGVKGCIRLLLGLRRGSCRLRRGNPSRRLRRGSRRLFL